MLHGSIIGKMIFKPVESILQVKCSHLHLFMGKCHLAKNLFKFEKLE